MQLTLVMRSLIKISHQPLLRGVTTTPTDEMTITLDVLFVLLHLLIVGQFLYVCDVEFNINIIIVGQAT